MLRRLLESQRARQRSRSAAFLSIALHLVVVGSAVAATNGERAETTSPVSPPPQPIYLPPAPRPATTVAPQPHDRRNRPVSPDAPPVIVPPLDISPTLPPIPDRGQPWTDFRIGTPTRPGTPREGDMGSLGAPAGIFGESEVERPASMLGSARTPRYPELLRRDLVEGSVLASYVVDTLGRAEPESFRALSATHPLFEQAVRSAVLGMRFRAAEVRGQRVRQLVEQRFVFTLTR